MKKCIFVTPEKTNDLFILCEESENYYDIMGCDFTKSMTIPDIFLYSNTLIAKAIGTQEDLKNTFPEHKGPMLSLTNYLIKSNSSSEYQRALLINMAKDIKNSNTSITDSQQKSYEEQMKNVV